MKIKRFCSLILAMAIVLTVVPCVGIAAGNIDLTDGLVLNYDFNSDEAAPTTVKDSSGFGYNGTVVNTTQGSGLWGGDVNNVLTTEGGFAKFPGYTKSSLPWGGDEVNTGAAIKIPFAVKDKITDDYTVSMWVKQDESYEYSGQPTRFFDFGIEQRDSIFLRYTPSTGDLRFQDRGQSGASANGSDCLISSTVNLGEVWNLVTVSYVKETQTARVYVNGNEVMSGSVFKRSIGDIGSLSNNAYGFYIGRTQWYNDYNWGGGERPNNPDFKGYMDDVRIYSRALSEDEIIQLYSGTKHSDDLKIIVSGNTVSIKTIVGTAPALPDEMNVTFADNTTGKIYVKWDEVSPSSYENKGRFTVSGTAYATGEMTDELCYGKIAAANVEVADANDSLNVGLVAYYPFTNDSQNPTTITDESGSGNDAQAYTNGETRANRIRRITVENGIADFPGRLDDRRSGAYIKIPENVRTGLKDYTVSMWVKANSSYAYAGRRQRIFDFGVGTYDSIFLRYVPSTGDLRFQDRGIGSGTDDSNSLISTTDNSAKDAWALMTITYEAESNTAIVYINGKESMRGNKFKRSIGDIPALTDSAYGMFIGRTVWNDTDNPDFCGKMDDIRIYNRAVTADEVRKLYVTTTPEKLTEIEITYELEDGTVIYSTSDAAGDNTRYTYDAPQTYEYEGATYTLSTTQSSLTINSVSESSKTIKAVYVAKKIASVNNYSEEIYRGSTPSLPKAVTVRYNTGESGQVGVEWESSSAEMFENVGTVTINGKTTSNEFANVSVSARITVYEITSVKIVDTVYTNVGTIPELPENAEVTFSHKEGTHSEAIVWETAISADELTAGSVIKAEGRLKNYPNIKVETNVEVILEYAKAYTTFADTYTHSGEPYSGHGTENELKITCTDHLSGYYGSGAGYNRHTFLKFAKPAGESPLRIKLKLFVSRIDNGAPTTYTLYGISPNWDENELTWNNQNSYIDTGVVVDTKTLSANTVNKYLEFDVTDYVENAEEAEISFYLAANTCATYVNSRESGVNIPTLECIYNGRLVELAYVCGDETVKTETVVMPMFDAEYTELEKVILASGKAYENTAQAVFVGAGTDRVEVKVTEAGEYEFDKISVSAYVGEEPTFPAEATARINDSILKVKVAFDSAVFDQAGIYTVSGTAEGHSILAEVKVYEHYTASNGTVIGYGVVVNNVFTNKNGEKIADTVRKIVPIGTVYSADDEILAYYPQVADAAGAEAAAVYDPVVDYEIVGERIDGVSGKTNAKLAFAEEAYEMNVTAYAANTGENLTGARLIIVRYDEEGKVIDFRTDTAELAADMYGRSSIEMAVPYDREANEDIRVYLWDSSSIRPLAAAILAAQLPEPDKISEEVKALIPEYETVVENIRRANNYWQSNISYNSWQNGIHPAFWDTAAYETGNMEAYFTLGDEAYKTYATNWAESNSWQGNTYNGSKDSWTYGYNQNQGSNAVLFGDWQICFQSYLDLNLLDPESRKIDRATEVMGYQITKDNDDFWWWADALYMVTPVMTKMYLTTGDEEYLNALYRYYKYSAELMYDGEGGIPTSRDGYTTSAYNGKRGDSSYSDPDDYKNLFFRDAGYVYPLSPNPGHENEKNFWARGNGWVFAGLAKILNDIPTNFEHYGFFSEIYTKMAKAIIDCQKIDSMGRGFWTQSMLQNYPVGSNGNNEGYETSGTAFFTYGLFWGLNSGMLDEETYLEPALRAWKYLSEEALHEDGKVGYVQPIGSNATQATAKSTTQPFGVGAFLLAGCEVSRWTGGVTEENAPYLMRKMWHGIAVNGDKYYVDGSVIEGTPSYSENGVLYVPLFETADFMDLDVEAEGSGYVVKDVSKSAMIQSNALVEKDGNVYISANTLARAVGRYVSVYGDVTVINHKSKVFFDCDAAAVEYLNMLLNN